MKEQLLKNQHQTRTQEHHYFPPLLLARDELSLTATHCLTVFAGRPPAEVSKRVEFLFAHKAKGVDLNEQIRGMRAFQNPSIYEKLVEMMEISETGQ